MLLACSGASNVGQIANDAAKALDQLGQGKMSCVIGIGARIQSFIDNAKQAPTCVVIDGCGKTCALQALANAGLAPNVHVVVTELGIAKEHSFNYSRDQIAAVAGAVADALKERESGDSCGCGCSRSCGGE